MRRIDVTQRRARLGVRQRLARPASTCVEVARALVGLHSSDPASVLLAAWARTDDLVPQDVERALYEERSLARVLGMRRTLFVVPVDLVATIHAACTRALAARERARLVRWLEQAGIAEDGGRWLQPVEQATLDALEARGQATAVELSQEVPELREQLSFGEGTRWEGRVGVSTRVLFLLATDGRVVRARPRGSWTSTQYRWAPLRSWLDVDVDAPPTDAARAQLACRWLATFGPGTFDDLKWWTGWTVAQTRRALAEVDPVEVDLGGATGMVLRDDVAPADAPGPWAALLPALDPTVMGWVQRDWYLGTHRAALFDRNGNAGPTVWWEGRVVGGWAQRDDGEIALRLLEDVGSDAVAAIGTAAARLADWLGDVRVVPRFRTPLERDLCLGRS
ncbi:MAG: winged helix DNA-binding domain-containing protein [Actinomycetota bacterium]|nr:winged helix DNA-binding domain-containing protein [Actinomycetota bacterium]